MNPASQDGLFNSAYKPSVLHRNSQQRTARLRLANQETYTFLDNVSKTFQAESWRLRREIV